MVKEQGEVTGVTKFGMTGPLHWKAELVEAWRPPVTAFPVPEQFRLDSWANLRYT